ncbi:DUF4430 domain-containing protein [Brevibacillus sp. H7]|uniref:DUF4430 domain-containing protein n=1 Tax=Brevibacillus sp. H7 TaxID=3349138 RepID=UPI00380879BF
MKRNDWLLMILSCLILLGAFVGLFQYRSAHAPESAPVPTPVEEPKVTGPHVQLRITKDFGAATVLDKPIPIQSGETVMDVLKRSGLELKTGYGGGFVESLGGLASQYRPGDTTSKKLDWFFYVNGLTADVGAAEYPVNAGDVVWWDYHNWDYAISTPAVIGAYPHPFRPRAEGETPVPLVIMAAKGFEAQAEHVAKSVHSVRRDEVKTLPWDEQLLSRESAFILVGDAKGLLSSAFIRELWQAKQNQGLFAGLTTEGIDAIDVFGQVKARYNESGTGLLLATVHPVTRYPIWIVSGTDGEGVEQAAKRLEKTSENQTSLSGFFGAIVNGQQIVRLPVVPNIGEAP